MPVKLLEASGNRIRLLIEGYPLPLVNAVRRACYTDVPVMAVDVVEFFDNNTVLYDEFLAHRIGLLPLTSEEAIKKYKPPEECVDRPLGDPDCYVVLRLEVETGPQETRVIYAGDLETTDPDVKPLHSRIPLVVMAPQQRIRLQAYARLGYGKEHAKWMPVNVAAATYTPVVKWDWSRDSSGECRRCLEQAAPWLVERMQGERGELEILDDVTTSAIRWCIERKCRGSGAATLEYRDDKLILKVESTGALSPRTVLLKAVEAIERKAESLLDAVQRLKSEVGQ